MRFWIPAFAGMTALVAVAPQLVDKPLTDPQTDIRELKLKDWQPKPMLVVKETRVEKPAFPVIDIHNHFFGSGNVTSGAVKHILAEMDAAGVRTVVTLDGGWGERLKALIRLGSDYRGRFCTFANLDFSGIDGP